MDLRLLVKLGVELSDGAFGAAFVLTYVAHSLIWVAAAAALVRARAISSATRHLHWKMALFGPLLSALSAVTLSNTLERSPAAASVFVQEVTLPALALSPAPTLARPSTPRIRGRLILTLVLAAAALGSVRFLGSAMLVRRRLRGRIQVTDPRLLRHLEAMRRRIGLRRIVLTECSAVDSPMVLGASEVCVPRALLDELTDAELDTVLAHELAHVERKDGLWFPLASAFQCVLWFYPLNSWVTSRFRDSAELACDDRAVELTRNPLGLASALVRVATSSSIGRRWSMMPAMARSESGLLPRLRRLTGARESRAEQPSRHAGPWATGLMLALAVALVSINVRIAEARPDRHPSPNLSARSAGPVGAPATAAPDMAEQGRRLSELAQREQLLSSQLEAARSLPNAEQEGSSDETRVLELSQALRHVLATESMLETRFAEEWAAWDAAHGNDRRASR